MLTKVCTKCGVEKEATLEHFYRSKDQLYGMKSICKECERACRKEYYINNKDKEDSRSLMYYHNNKERLIQQNKTYKEHNKERLHDKNLEYKSNHKERAKHLREIYYAKNREKILVYAKIYAQKNKHSIQIRNKEWSIKNRDKTIEYNQQRRAKKKSLEHSLTKNQWEEIKRSFDNKCCYCGKEALLHQEHFVALSKDGDYTINNIVPSCKSCNSSKRDKDFFDWYPNYKYYSKFRERKILKYLNYNKDKTQQLALII